MIRPSWHCPSAAQALIKAGLFGAKLSQFNRAAYLAWAPQRCGAFTVVVRNTGTAPAAYRLSTAPSKAGIVGCAAAPAPARAEQRKTTGTHR